MRSKNATWLHVVIARSFPDWLSFRPALSSFLKSPLVGFFSIENTFGLCEQILTLVNQRYLRTQFLWIDDATQLPASICWANKARYMASLEPSCWTRAKAAAEWYHEKIPYLRKLPAPVIGIIFAVVVANLICWAGVGVVLVCNL